ncbi:MAG: hypothetical protein Q7R41_00270, partial [Phycisphaerales bacterium]|nr:hypothetical protein [Phycisphaerales bacterium]
MCNHSVRLHRLALCAFMALADWSAAQAAGTSQYDFTPLSTTTIDPDLGHETKLDVSDRGGAHDSDSGVAASVGGCDSLGGFNAAFPGSFRYRGNLIRITQSDVTLHELKMQLNFTGTADLYVSVHRHESDGTYTRLMSDKVIQGAVGTGTPVFYSSGLINNGDGIALPFGFAYAVAFAWGSTSITFAHDGLAYPRTFDAGSVLGSLAMNLGNSN